MTIVFAIPSYFPYGTPYSSRALNLCRLLRDSGHKVILFCDYLSDKQLKVKTGIAEFENIKIHYLTENRDLFDKATVMYRTPHQLDNFLSENEVDLLMTSSVSNRIERIIRIGRKHNLPILLESCEKFHSSNWKFGKLDFRYIRFRHCWEKVYCKADGVIAISRLLQEHFESKGIPAIRVPTILDVESRESRRLLLGHKEAIRFVFAGSLGGGKDRVAEMIRAIDMLEEEKRNRICFDIYGPTEDDIIKQLGQDAQLLERVSNIVHINEKVGQQMIPEILRASDFGIVLRPDRESSHAGFPTKLAECMEVGTPIFANRTGDIGLYVEDGVSGILIEDNSTEAIKRGIERALLMSEEDCSAMRKAARDTAEKNFDYRRYIAPVCKLIDRLTRTDYKKTKRK